MEGAEAAVNVTGTARGREQPGSGPTSNSGTLTSSGHVPLTAASALFNAATTFSNDRWYDS